MRVVCFTSAENKSIQIVLPALLNAGHDVVEVVIGGARRWNRRRRLRWLMRYYGPVYTARRMLLMPVRRLASMFFRLRSPRQSTDGSVGRLVSSLNVPVRITSSHNSTRNQRHVKPLNPDVGIICGTGRIDRKVFSIPKHGCVNFHSGIVPEYRGLDTIF